MGAPGSEQLSADKISDHLMSMIEQANASSRTWVQLYVAVQSGLGLGAGAVIAFWQTEADVLGWFFGLVPVFLAAMGIAFGAAVTAIIIRAHKWQAWWIRRFQALQTTAGPLFLFPDYEVEPEAVTGLPAGKNAGAIKWANRVVVFAWILMSGTIAGVMYYLSDAPLPW